jgi:hypothetical protein
MCTIFTIHPLPHVHPRSPSKILYTGSADRGRRRITGVYGIDDKTCGFLHHRDTLESSESTAKIWLNSAWYRISEIHPLERSSCEGMHRHMPTRSRPLKALIALELLGATPRGYDVAGGDGALAHTSATSSRVHHGKASSNRSKGLGTHIAGWQ